MMDLLAARWRMGRRNNRTIYAVVGSEPSDADVFIGTLVTAELVGLVIVDHNQMIDFHGPVHSTRVVTG